MTFIKQLHSHIGGLIRLKSQIYWYNSASCDGVEERVCLLLDITEEYSAPSGNLPDAEIYDSRYPNLDYDPSIIALLLVDASPTWVWVYEDAVEFIQ